MAICFCCCKFSALLLIDLIFIIRKKLRLEQQYGGSGCSNEKELFHGTLPTYVDVICKDNLDFRLAGERVGTLFGKGTYFAIDAKYSDLYSQVDKEKNKFMFLVKVLCGKCALGDTKYSRPPPVDRSIYHILKLN